MSSELSCRAVVPPARDEGGRHFAIAMATIDSLTLPSPLSKRRGDIGRGTAPLQPGCPAHLPRRYVSRGACFSPLHCEGRDNRAVHFTRSRRRLVATLSQGLPRFAPRLFSVDRTGCEDYRIVGENRDGCFAKCFFAGKFGVSLFRSNE
jgi:hypothetical protein